MKRIPQRAMTALLCAALLLASPVGCAPKAANDPATGAGTSSDAGVDGAVPAGNASEAKSDGKPVPIRIFNRLNPEVQIDDNPLIEALEKKLNISIEYEAPPINNYVDKLQITMASGDLPDLIYNWGGADANYEQWAKSGLLMALDDEIAKYPNLQKNITPEMYEATRSIQTGKLHCVPKTNMDNYWGFIINKQWLEKLDLPIPHTLDEFTDVMRAFTTQDPDGDGKDNTYGLSSTGTSIEPFKYAFRVTDSTRDYDGQYKISTKMSGYMPYLTYLRELYAEKILDTEFFTNKYNVDTEKRRSNIVGMTVSHQGGYLNGLTVQPDALERYTYIAGPVDTTTGEQVMYARPAVWGGFMISADSKVQDKCLELLDYGNGQEGFMLTSIGIEGTHYNAYDYATRMIDRTPEQATEYQRFGSSYFTFAFAMEGMPCIIENGDTQERVDAFHAVFDPIKASTTFEMLPSVTAPLFKTWGADHPDLSKEFGEMEIKYVVGEITREEYQSFLDTKYFPAWADAEAEYVQWMEDYEARMK